MIMEPLMSFNSYIGGKTAVVEIYPDRIEWSRVRRPGIPGLQGRGGLLGAIGSQGRRKDTTTIPVRQITSITAHRDNLLFTTVRVDSASGATEFRTNKGQADEVKATLLRLMTGGEQSASVG